LQEVRLGRVRGEPKGPPAKAQEEEKILVYLHQQVQRLPEGPPAQRQKNIEKN
jgi:hypothetical protein